MGKINIKSLITTHEDLKEEKESQSHRLLYNYDDSSSLADALRAKVNYKVAYHISFSCDFTLSLFSVT